MSIPDADNLTVRDASILLLMSLMGPHTSEKLVVLNDEQLRDTLLAVTAFIKSETESRGIGDYVEH